MLAGIDKGFQAELFHVAQAAADPERGDLMVTCQVSAPHVRSQAAPAFVIVSLFLAKSRKYCNARGGGRRKKGGVDVLATLASYARAALAREVRVKFLVISAVRNEGPFLLEWIAHHRAAGVDRFLIYSNDCEDGTAALLDALAPAGVVHVPQVVAAGATPQWQALGAAWRHPLRKAADWIAVIDCDEFVNLRAPLAGLADLVQAAGPADAIVLKWRLFGCNGQARALDRPTTEVFTAAAPDVVRYPFSASMFKTLFRNGARFRKLGVHRPRARKGEVPAWVDGAGRALPESFARRDEVLVHYGQPGATRLVQLNHYSLRSAESFMVKSARGLPNHIDKKVDLNYWVERNFNTEPDVSIARMADATAAEMAALRALPGVAALHAAAVDWHRAKFRQMMRDEEAVKLYGRLLMAADSRDPAGEAGADLAGWRVATHARRRAEKG
jgi:hypothetical protein